MKASLPLPLYTRAMRVWLVLLLTLSFALSGWASMRPSSAPCPAGMDTPHAAPVLTASFSAQEAVTAPAGEGDCYNDMATYFSTGQHCKTGQDCQATAAALPVLFTVTTRSHASQTVPQALSPDAPLPVVTAVWRPPSLL